MNRRISERPARGVGLLPGAARVLVALALLTAGAADAATRIYRTVDEDGNVVFTDVPPKEGEPGRAVDLNEGSTFTPPQPTETPQPQGRSLESWLGSEPGEEPEQQQAAAGYQSLEIASPASDEPIRDNAGNVTVVAAVDPELNPAHTVQVYLDGQLRMQGSTTRFQLTNLDRGSHRVALRIIDASGNTLAASEPTLFHLQRRSVILQPANRRAN